MRLFLACLFFLIGISVSSLFAVTSEVSLFASIFCYCIVLLLPKHKIFGLLLLCAACFYLGIWRYQSVLPAYSIDPYLEQQVTLSGFVDERPYISNETKKAVVTVQSLAIDTQEVPLEVKLLLSLPKYTVIEYGDQLVVRGKISKPPIFETFDYEQYLFRKGVLGIMSRATILSREPDTGNTFLAMLYSLNTFTETRINELLPEPQSSLLAGLLLGVKRGFSEVWTKAFSTTGTTHIIAISGYNITIIVVAVTGLLGTRLQRRKRFLILLIGIILFITFIGLQPSAVRAGVMGIYALTAREVGKRRDMTAGLLFAAAAMCFVSPMVLWDVGFQLSFLATVGLVYAVPLLSSIPIMQKVQSIKFFGIGENLVTTLGAQIGVLPVILYYFGSLSLIAPLANILVLETIPITMLLGFLAFLSSCIHILLGKLFAMMTWVLLTYTLWVIQSMSNVPFAAISVPVITPLFIVIYYAVFLWVVYKRGLL